MPDDSRVGVDPPASCSANLQDSQRSLYKIVYREGIYSRFILEELVLAVRTQEGRGVLFRNTCIISL